MVITVDIPEELASRLRPIEDQLPRILELGLRELSASPEDGYGDMADVLEVLAALPSPEEVLALHASQALQDRIGALLEKNRADGLSPAEEQEWERYEYLEHLVRIAKAKARLRLSPS